jgi:hypothetical protein
MNDYAEALNKMISRRITKGGNPTEAQALLNDQVTKHTGENLVYALCYWGFATEAQARKFAVLINLASLTK